GLHTCLCTFRRNGLFLVAWLQKATLVRCCGWYRSRVNACGGPGGGTVVSPSHAARQRNKSKESAHVHTGLVAFDFGSASRGCRRNFVSRLCDYSSPPITWSLSFASLA